MSEFSKREIALRYWLQGSEYFKALEAMDFAKQFHTGTRKDGVTPEFDHQISIGHYARSLPNLMHQEDTISVIFLHDVREDFDVSEIEIENRFGKNVSIAVDCMTKVFRGVKRPAEDVFTRIGNDPLASIAKGGDRIHNFGSMVGVFSMTKQQEYIDEGVKHFFPMLKAARRHFPRQEMAYENIKLMLKSQIHLIREIHKAANIS